MGATGCLLLLAAIAAHAAAYGEMKEEVVVELPFSQTGYCIRQLNATYQVGCTSSKNGDEGVSVVARTKADVEGASEGWKDRFPSYSGDFMVLMDEMLLDGDTVPLLISSPRVSGVLLMPTKEGLEVDKSIPLSAEAACPNRHSSLYSDWRACGSSEGRQWNGKGAMLEEGLRFTEWPKPMARVLNESVLQTMIKCHDAYNLPDSREGKVKGRLCAVGTVKTYMLAHGSATECMRRQEAGIFRQIMGGVTGSIWRTLCDQLSDFNLFGIFPPEVEKKEAKAEYLAIITRMDSIAMIPYVSPSTYGTMTSLVAALTAAKVIGDNMETFENASKKSNKRLIFAFLNGESSDYLGSSRWVYDMEHGQFPKRKSGEAVGDEPELISMDKITLAVELQQLDGSRVLHAHADGKNYQADAKGKIKKALDKMKNAMAEDGYNLRVEKVDANGVLPPSSLHSILKKRREIPSFLVTSFGEQYSNRRFHSVYDRVTGGEEEVQKVKKSLAAVASGVVAMMADHVGIDEETQRKLKINQKWLDMLSSCFIATTKIPDCPYFKTLLDNPEVVDRSTSMNALTRSLVLKTVHKLLFLATGEHKSTTNIHDEESCKHVNEKQALFEYVWQLDPAQNKTFCYRTSIRAAVAESPAFITKDEGTTDVAGSPYSTWVESRWQTSVHYSLFLVESRPADWTLWFAGILSLLLSLLIMGRCDGSSFVVDEGERAAEDGEPL